MAMVKLGKKTFSPRVIVDAKVGIRTAHTEVQHITLIGGSC